MKITDPHHPLWILQFEEGDKKKTVLLIPPPPGSSSDWIDTNHNVEEKTLDALAVIHDICEQMKQDCLDEIKTIDQSNFQGKAKKVGESLRGLDRLIKRFNEILNRSKKKPPKTD